jgi:hypothetical protein
MNYSTLTKTQRRVVDAFVELDPSLSGRRSITRQEVEALWKTLFEARLNGGPKIGYPMWLVKGRKVSRGEYAFPAPEFAAKGNTTSAPMPQVSSKEDEEFFAEIAEAGLLEEVA